MNKQQQSIKLEPHFKTRIETARKDLDSTFALVIVRPDMLEILFCHVPGAMIPQNLPCESQIFCLSYGLNKIEITNLNDALINYLTEFSYLFLSENINIEVVKKFLSRFKQHGLTDRNAKSIAVENMIFASHPEKDSSELIYIDFLGNAFSVLEEISNICLLGANENKKTQTLKRFIDYELKREGKIPNTETLKKKIEQLFPENSVSEMSFIRSVTHQTPKPKTG